MRLHILGVCGTLMGSIALLAREQGHRVTGSDAEVYPPMSEQLEAAGIALQAGYAEAGVPDDADLILVGNAGLPRGNPAVEKTLRGAVPFMSGAEWLARQLLPGRWTLAVAGTHGKTSASAMLAWILEAAGLEPGFLIGGVPVNFGVSARLGAAPFFVIEADEYDTSYFDRRAKFLHYLPRTLVINNLEYDHADIYPSLEAIKQQFHLLLRTVPDDGLVVRPVQDPNLDDVLARGCWTPVARFGSAAAGDAAPAAQAEDARAQAGDMAAQATSAAAQADGAAAQATSAAAQAGGAAAQATSAVAQAGGMAAQYRLLDAGASRFEALLDGKLAGRVDWQLGGEHNAANALAAILAARHAGVAPGLACEALCDFKGVKRRMELLYDRGGVRVYDDFAHHPTAIAATLAGLRARVGSERIIALIDPASHTMRQGVHAEALARAASAADHVIWHRGEKVAWPIADLAGSRSQVLDSIPAIIKAALALAAPPCHIVIMSNGAFGGIHGALVEQLSAAS